MTATPTASTSSKRAAVCVMAIGLGLTVVATIVPYVTDALAHHLDTGYPRYTEEEIATAVTVWLAILTTTGVLGVLCWLATIRLVLRGARWASSAAAAAFTIGLAVALTCLLVKDSSGDTGLPPLLGWLGMLPCLPGLLAVALLSRKP
jgi:hypothetical protein